MFGFRLGIKIARTTSRTTSLRQIPRTWTVTLTNHRTTILPGIWTCNHIHTTAASARRCRDHELEKRRNRYSKGYGQ